MSGDTFFRASLTLVAVASVLGGCFPYTRAFFLPEATEGSRSSHSTLTSAAPVWYLERGGAQFAFSASGRPGEATTFILNIQPLRVAGDTSLLADARDKARANVQPVAIGLEEGEDPNAILVNGSSEGVKEILVTRGQYGTSRGPAPVALRDGDIWLALDQYAEIRVTVDIGESRSHLVQWPALMIDGHRVTFPPVTFTWKRGMQIAFIND